MSGKCPKDSDLVRLSLYETSHDESERLFRHLADCPRCSTRFTVLRQVKRDLRPAVESFAREFDADQAGPLLSSAARRKLQELGRPPAPPRPGPKLFGLRLDLRLAAGFLAVLAVVAAGIYMTATNDALYSNLRSPASGPTLIEPVGTVSRVPAVFRWSPVPNAENYVLELFDDSLERVLHRSAYLINELALPADVRARLVEERTYLWTISAYDGDSVLLASQSGTFIIE